MASSANNNNPTSTTENAIHSEEELIDLDEALPFKLDSNWLIEYNGYSTEFQDSFSKLHFSNPYINDMIKSVYQSGKSKQVLHQLLYWNEKMTVSCDNCTYLYRNTAPEIIYKKDRISLKRHSVAVTSLAEDNAFHSSKSSLTDSLDSITIANDITKVADDNGNDLSVVTDRMTQSSITDYDREVCRPTVSNTVPLVKGVSTSQNVLSRTYDKEDLEVLKQTELSKSVFVPHITGSTTEHYSKVELRDQPKPTSVNLRHTFARSAIVEPAKNSYVRRQFPAVPILKNSIDIDRRSRPNSAYQVDKLTKSTMDRCLKMRQLNMAGSLSTKRLLQMNENIFETDVLTPINSPRNKKHFINQQSRLRRPNDVNK